VNLDVDVNLELKTGQVLVQHSLSPVGLLIDFWARWPQPLQLDGFPKLSVGDCSLRIRSVVPNRDPSLLTLDCPLRQCILIEN